MHQQNGTRISVDPTGDEHFPAVVVVAPPGEAGLTIYLHLTDLDRLILEADSTRRLILDGDQA